MKKLIYYLAFIQFFLGICLLIALLCTLLGCASTDVKYEFNTAQQQVMDRGVRS